MFLFCALEIGFPTKLSFNSLVIYQSIVQSIRYIEAIHSVVYYSIHCFWIFLPIIGVKSRYLTLILSDDWESKKFGFNSKHESMNYGNPYWNGFDYIYFFLIVIQLVLSQKWFHTKYFFRNGSKVHSMNSKIIFDFFFLMN